MPTTSPPPESTTSTPDPSTLPLTSLTLSPTPCPAAPPVPPILLTAAAAPPTSPPQPHAPSPPPQPHAPAAPGCMAWGAVLRDQCFSGTPLERSLDILQKFDGTASASASASGPSTEASLVVVAGRSICARPAPPLAAAASPPPPDGSEADTGSVAPPLGPGSPGGQQGSGAQGSARSQAGDAPPAPLSGPQDLQALLLPLTDPQLELNSEQLSFNWMEDPTDQMSDSAHSEKDGSTVRRLPLYLLGRDRDQRWTFAIDISSCKQAFLRFLKVSCQLDVVMADLRTLMPLLSREACAVAGQAVGLSQWHETNRFCPRCGGDSLPIETGLRRRCVRDPSHKMYPRTDPVVIMLVESPDGQRALLGRNKRFSPGMYTCLSGFIDQCEGIEEAVRREVREEAMVQVDAVLVVGSQPWPIGRYGTCELMLACMAKAQSYTILVNTAEMEDVQWYDKAELRAAVQQYDTVPERPLAELQQASMDALGFWVPPPVAIAHHLIRTWAMHDGPFFPSERPPMTKL